MPNFTEMNKKWEQNVEDFHNQQDEADWLKELDELGLLPVNDEEDEEDEA